MARGDNVKKSIITLLCAIFIVFCGCAHLSATGDDSEVVADMLHFSSPGDLLDAHKTVAAGGDIADFVSYWRATSTESNLSDVVESVNFSSLERLYLPTNIPEDYQIYRIDISKEFVSIWYLPEAYINMQDGFPVATNQQKYFHFSFTRWNTEPLSDSAMDDLNDDRYGFDGHNMIQWSFCNERFLLYTPTEMGNDRSELIRFAEMRIVEVEK